jgi:hypothetical protein
MTEEEPIADGTMIDATYEDEGFMIVPAIPEEDATGGKTDEGRKPKRLRNIGRRTATDNS